MTGRSGMLRDGWRMAVGTLTAFPVRPPGVVDRATAGVAMVAGPIAVVPIAAVAALVGWSASAVVSPLVAAVLTVGCFALGSRGLHLDGLADTADGLAASYDRDRALQVMRRGDTGPAGAAALVLLLLLQTAALVPVLSRPFGASTAAVLLCLARSSLLITCAAGVPAARPAGLGASVAGAVGRRAGFAGGLVAAGVAAAALAMSGRPWWQGPAAVAVAGAAVSVLTLRCCQRFGGITGDVLGAGIEVAAGALLLAAAAG